MLRKRLHVERFNYHVTTQPTTETARHASLAAHTHSTEKRTRHEITRHGHTRRTSTGATQPALDHSGACEHAASCSDGGRSGCSILTSGACAAKSLDISTHLPGRGRGGSIQRWRVAGAGQVCGRAAHSQEALSARSREFLRMRSSDLVTAASGQAGGHGGSEHV